jgi:hypothetical protein
MMMNMEGRPLLLWTVIDCMHPLRSPPHPPPFPHPPPKPPTRTTTDRETFGLEMSAELKGVCSPSFDSWLIVSQAVANVALAAQFKAAGRSRRFVDQVGEGTGWDAVAAKKGGGVEYLGDGRGMERNTGYVLYYRVCGCVWMYVHMWPIEQPEPDPPLLLPSTPPQPNPTTQYAPTADPRQVENQGLILAHFHGFINRSALPPNVAFFGQDKAPLPCGSVESAAVTVEGKRAIAAKALALPDDINYLGACCVVCCGVWCVVCGVVCSVVWCAVICGVLWREKGGGEKGREVSWRWR